MHLRKFVNAMIIVQILQFLAVIKAAIVMHRAACRRCH